MGNLLTKTVFSCITSSGRVPWWFLFFFPPPRVRFLTKTQIEHDTLVNFGQSIWLQRSKSVCKFASNRGHVVTHVVTLCHLARPPVDSFLQQERCQFTLFVCPSWTEEGRKGDGEREKEREGEKMLGRDESEKPVPMREKKTSGFIICARLASSNMEEEEDHKVADCKNNAVARGVHFSSTPFRVDRRLNSTSAYSVASKPTALK
jgi:hypothetical protein